MSNFSRRAKAEAAKYQHQINPKYRHKYNFGCGAGKQGSKGFQPGNTCGGDGDGKDDKGDQGGGDKPKNMPKKIGKPKSSEEAQQKIARDTVENPNKALLGGPSVDEAREILAGAGYTDEQLDWLQYGQYGEAAAADAPADAPGAGDGAWNSEVATKQLESLHDSPDGRKYAALRDAYDELDEAGVIDTVEDPMGDMWSYPSRYGSEEELTEAFEDNMIDAIANLETELALSGNIDLVEEARAAAEAQAPDDAPEAADLDPEDRGLVDEVTEPAADAGAEVKGKANELTSQIGNLHMEPDNPKHREAVEQALVGYGTAKGWSEENIDHALNVGPVSGITDDPMFGATRAFLSGNKAGEDTSQMWEDVVNAEEYVEAPADAPAAGDAGAEGGAVDASDSTPGNLSGGYGVGKDPGNMKWSIDKDGLMDTDAGYFNTEEQARLAAFTQSLRESGDLDAYIDDRDLGGFVAYAEDYEDNPLSSDLHPDDLDSMATNFQEKHIGTWEEKKVAGTSIPSGFTEDYVEQIGGVGQLDESTRAGNTNYQKWNDELDSVDEGMGWRERADGKYETYDRQDEDMEPTVYDYLHEAQDAAKESNDEILDDMVREGDAAKHPGSGESYAERYFDYDGFAHDLVLGGDITYVEDSAGMKTWLWG
jgi:hypothetical protein